MSPRSWKVLPAIGLIALTGCRTTDSAPEVSSTPNSLQSALPANYRAAIVERARKEFFDPYSIRDAAISQPIAGRSLSGDMASVCIQANGKNRMGAYTGLQTTVYIFRNGQITLTDQQYTGEVCGKATYEPFPELEGKPTPAAAKPRA